MSRVNSESHDKHRSRTDFIIFIHFLLYFIILCTNVVSFFNILFGYVKGRNDLFTLTLAELEMLLRSVVVNIQKLSAV